jgi:hypothetical protein
MKAKCRVTNRSADSAPGERMLRASTASVALNGCISLSPGPSLSILGRRAERFGLSALIAEQLRVVGCGGW